MHSTRCHHLLLVLLRLESQVVLDVPILIDASFSDAIDVGINAAVCGDRLQFFIGHLLRSPWIWSRLGWLYFFQLHAPNRRRPSKVARLEEFRFLLDSGTT